MKKGEEETNMKKIFSIIVGLILIFTITSCQNDKKIIEKLKENGEYAKLVMEIENCRSKD